MANKKQSKKKKDENKNIAYVNWSNGDDIVYYHPLFHGLRMDFISLYYNKDYAYPANGLARVSRSGSIYCNPEIIAEPKVWARSIAHCVLHLAMGHFVEVENQHLWNIACDCAVERFLTEMKFGTTEHNTLVPIGFTNEQTLYEEFLISGVPDEYKGFGTAGYDSNDMIFDKPGRHTKEEWSKAFATGLSNAVRAAVNTVSDMSTYRAGNSKSEKAKAWFVSSFPLLGAIATEFRIIEDHEICQRMGIKIAAISCSLQEIYLNPLAGLTSEELRFVIAHELLHAALRHDIRHEWRDPFLWNLACDFVINGWLVEMRVGERPDGVLYDEQYKELSAENVYDMIISDLKAFSKLATLRGAGLGDILPGDAVRKDSDGNDFDLDDFYRRALSQGLEYHQNHDRGYLPSGLIEEIRALAHPPIPWDVELARWFDEMFEPVEKQRSYARPSRRQSSTPDIPRPSSILRQEQIDKRTFGVVLDTSGSMDRKLLATALGAIASYSAVRDVPGVRVVFCDAAAYDQGYMKPEDIAGSVEVRGRGGTILQPGIDVLKNAEDFPNTAPILIITDAECEDRLKLYGREHAYLIPDGAKLPFVPKGKVFRMR